MLYTYLVHLKYYYEKGVCGLYQTVNKVKCTKTVKNFGKLFCDCMTLLS